MTLTRHYFEILFIGENSHRVPLLLDETLPFTSTIIFSPYVKINSLEYAKTKKTPHCTITPQNYTYS